MNKKPTQSKLVSKILGWYNYATTGVWEDTRNTIGVRLMKTLNLAVRSFTDRGLQIRSMSLTYSTVLAIVPAFALLIAIGRGFGCCSFGAARQNNSNRRNT